MLPALLGLHRQPGDAAAEKKPPQYEPEEKTILKIILCFTFTPTLLAARVVPLNRWVKEHFQEAGGNDLQTPSLRGAPGDAGVTWSFTPEPKVNLNSRTKAFLFVLACQGLRLLKVFSIIGLSLSQLLNLLLSAARCLPPPAGSPPTPGGCSAGSPRKTRRPGPFGQEQPCLGWGTHTTHTGEAARGAGRQRHVPLQKQATAISCRPGETPSSKNATLLRTLRWDLFLLKHGAGILPGRQHPAKNNWNS